MHNYFGEWYREVDADPNSETIKKRWTAIDKFTKRKTSIEEKGLELIRIFFSLPTNSSFVDSFRKEFLSADPGFRMRDNDYELKVLSGATIIHIIETKQPEIGEMLALAVLTCNCQGLRGDLPIPDVLNIAHDFLMKRSIEVRALDEASEIREPDLSSADFLQNLKKVSEGANLVVFAEIIGTFFSKFLGSIKEFSSATVKTTISLRKALDLQREESNILWWLFAEASRDLNKPWREMEVSAACLASGKELADLTVFMPGPYASEHFLSRIMYTIEGDLPEQLSIYEVVNSSPRDWRVALLKRLETQGILEICPIHQAIVKSLETDGSDDWISAYEKATTLKARDCITPLGLSLQIYRERLFIQAFNALTT